MTLTRYLTAAEWGMTWVRPPVAEKQLDPEVYIHHVGGQAWMDQDAITVFRNLNTYAQRPKTQGGKGYSALDYDVLVHYHRKTDTLTIAEGRGKWLSAATQDRNEQGEAVCVCGNYTLREPLPIEVEGAALGVVYGIRNGWVAEDAAILGHKDNPAHLGATGCPGDNMYTKLPEVRSRVATILNPPPPPVYVHPSEDEDMAICVNHGGGYWLSNEVQRTPLVYPGNDWALIALMWELEDRGVRFASPKGTPGDEDRIVPVPYVITDVQAPTFNKLPTS